MGRLVYVLQWVLEIAVTSHDTLSSDCLRTCATCSSSLSRRRQRYLRGRHLQHGATMGKASAKSEQTQKQQAHARLEPPFRYVNTTLRARPPQSSHLKANGIQLRQRIMNDCSPAPKPIQKRPAHASPGRRSNLLHRWSCMLCSWKMPLSRKEAVLLILLSVQGSRTLGIRVQSLAPNQDGLYGTERNNSTNTGTKQTWLIGTDSTPLQLTGSTANAARFSAEQIIRSNPDHGTLEPAPLEDFGRKSV